MYSPAILAGYHNAPLDTEPLLQKSNDAYQI